MNHHLLKFLRFGAAQNQEKNISTGPVIWENKCRRWGRLNLPILWVPTETSSKPTFSTIKTGIFSYKSQTITQESILGEVSTNRHLVSWSLIWKKLSTSNKRKNTKYSVQNRKSQHPKPAPTFKLLTISRCHRSIIWDLPMKWILWWGSKSTSISIGEVDSMRRILSPISDTLVLKKSGIWRNCAQTI